jgi:NAD(P)-dependent dehydrogenase (short-subunit alcohol dehydrogenase family)
MNTRRIEGTVALVTGANRGIGRALTEALLTRGAKRVYATARNPESLRDLRHDRLVALRLAPSLARNGGGAVVNVGSAAGLTNVPFLPTYSASKAALHSLTQAARVLLGPQGTAVFGVYAGPVDTDMVRELAMPKTSAREVALAILDGIEAGQEDIFPDPFAVDFGRRFQTSPTASEQQIATMVLGSAA